MLQHPLPLMAPFFATVCRSPVGPIAFVGRYGNETRHYADSLIDTVIRIDNGTVVLTGWDEELTLEFGSPKAVKMVPPGVDAFAADADIHEALIAVVAFSALPTAHEASRSWPGWLQGYPPSMLETTADGTSDIALWMVDISADDGRAIFAAAYPDDPSVTAAIDQRIALTVEFNAGIAGDRGTPPPDVTDL